MQKAFERREVYSPEGKCLWREWSVGPIVPWAIVVLAAEFAGKGLVSLQPSLWHFIK
jgi:hypothetical protein